ncbi:hypothetical protein J6590_087756 [Homalodisca vitripennis]|nr:hypothetical protein J6590_087756 [Homalodisca vitripennis]
MICKSDVRSFIHPIVIFKDRIMKATVKYHCMYNGVTQDNQIKHLQAWRLLRCSPCKRSACPGIGGGSEVTFKQLVPM